MQAVLRLCCSQDSMLHTLLTLVTTLLTAIPATSETATARETRVSFRLSEGSFEAASHSLAAILQVVLGVRRPQTRCQSQSSEHAVNKNHQWHQHVIIASL